MTRPERKTRMRHLETKNFKIHEAIKNKEISISYVKSENNVADLMTKALSKAAHLGTLKHIGFKRANN